MVKPIRVCPTTYILKLLILTQYKCMFEHSITNKLMFSSCFPFYVNLFALVVKGRYIPF